MGEEMYFFCLERSLKLAIVLKTSGKRNIGNAINNNLGYSSGPILKEPAIDWESTPHSTNPGSIACMNNAIIRMDTVGAISLREILCKGSGTMYHPNLERTINWGGLSLTSQSKIGVSVSSSLYWRHSTNHPKSLPIEKTGNDSNSDLIATSTIGTSLGFM